MINKFLQYFLSDKEENNSEKTVLNRDLLNAEADNLSKRLQHPSLDNAQINDLHSRLFYIAKEFVKDPQGRELLTWLETNSLALVHQSQHGKRGNSEAFFSPGEECRNAIIDLILDAKKSLDICVFTISDDKISREIIAAHRRKIKVRILTDNEKMLDKGSDIEEFHRAGIEIKVDTSEAHMHHKFMLADKKHLLNGSYNWTRSAAELNQENILITSEKTVVERFTQEFERLWRTLSPYQKGG